MSVPGKRSTRDGVWRSQREGHGFLKFGSETDFVEELEEAAEAAKGRDGFGGGFDPKTGRKLERIVLCKG